MFYGGGPRWIDMKIYTVYVLKSEKDGKRYIGTTQNLSRRIAEHNRGKVSSTALRKPLRILYTESYSMKQEAQKRERYLKSGAGREWLNRRDIK